MVAGKLRLHIKGFPTITTLPCHTHTAIGRTVEV